MTNSLGGQQPRPASDTEEAGGPHRERPRMPPVRLAPRDELAAAARVAPLLRAARDLSAWAARRPEMSASEALAAADACAAAEELELTPDELDSAWQVVVAAAEAGGERGEARRVGAAGDRQRRGRTPGVGRRARGAAGCRGTGRARHRPVHGGRAGADRRALRRLLGCGRHAAASRARRERSGDPGSAGACEGEAARASPSRRDRGGDGGPAAGRGPGGGPVACAGDAGRPGCGRAGHRGERRRADRHAVAARCLGRTPAAARPGLARAGARCG